MDRSHYLHVHIPGRGLLTLSFPEGVARALWTGRLPDGTLAWHTGGEVWVPLAEHPAVVHLLLLDASPVLPEISDPIDQSVASDLVFLAEPVDPTPSDAAFDAIMEQKEVPLPVPESDSAELPLILLEDWVPPHAEFSQFLARSSAQERRRDAVRNSGGARPSGAMKVFVAGTKAVEDTEVGETRRWRLGLSPMQRLVAALAFLLVGGGAAGSVWYVKEIRSVAAPRPDRTVTNALSAGRPGPGDTTVFLAGTPEGMNSVVNPLAESETDLENNLRIAEAAVWQPALDFASPDQIVRSTRKVDAVRNSISLYRVASWQLIDSLRRDSDPRLEPFTEANRIDDVVNVMQSAVILLDSLVARYHVRGDLLVFDHVEEAERYNALCRMADSLIHAPVDLDSFKSMRAPRRVVTRLLGTLPPGVTQYRKR